MSVRMKITGDNTNPHFQVLEQTLQKVFETHKVKDKVEIEIHDKGMGMVKEYSIPRNEKIKSSF